MCSDKAQRGTFLIGFGTFKVKIAFGTKLYLQHKIDLKVAQKWTKIGLENGGNGQNNGKNLSIFYFFGPILMMFLGHFSFYFPLCNTTELICTNQSVQNQIFNIEFQLFFVQYLYQVTQQKLKIAQCSASQKLKLRQRSCGFPQCQNPSLQAIFTHCFQRGLTHSATKFRPRIAQQVTVHFKVTNQTIITKTMLYHKSKIFSVAWINIKMQFY